MTVLLTILKVIGWILLGILGLILLTVLTVLLVPIRYRADGVWKEEKYIRGRVTWLLHLLSIRVTYEKELLLEVRVAGFLIYPKKERSGKKKKAASGADAEEGVGDADADTNVLDADGAKMPSADFSGRKSKKQIMENDTMARETFDEVLQRRDGYTQEEVDETRQEILDRIVERMEKLDSDRAHAYEIIFCRR